MLQPALSSYPHTADTIVGNSMHHAVGVFRIQRDDNETITYSIIPS